MAPLRALVRRCIPAAAVFERHVEDRDRGIEAAEERSRGDHRLQAADLHAFAHLAGPAELDSAGFADVAGLEAFKRWLDRRRPAFRGELAQLAKLAPIIGAFVAGLASDQRQVPVHRFVNVMGCPVPGFPDQN